MKGAFVPTALDSLGVTDLRAAYRERLKSLRVRDEEAFRRATSYYESEVAPRLSEPSEAIEAWIGYGRMLGELSGAGHLVAIDATGRARPYETPFTRGMLVLFVPEESRDEVLPAAVPVEASPAQQATIALLVEKRLSL